MIKNLILKNLHLINKKIKKNDKNWILMIFRNLMKMMNLKILMIRVLIMIRINEKWVEVYHFLIINLFNSSKITNN